MATNEGKMKTHCCERVCDACGTNKYVLHYRGTGNYYCSKHYYQMDNFGAIVKTIMDRNEIVNYGDYFEVILTDRYNNEKGRVKVSNDKLNIIKDYRWYLTSAGYACSKSNGGKAVLLHRLISKVNTNEIVDHINRDKLDCRNKNLRVCSRSNNAMNSSLSNRNKSGSTGVWYEKTRGRWVAEIFERGKKHYLGSYIDKNDAIKARKEAEQKYFGEFSPTRGESNVN